MNPWLKVALPAYMAAPLYPAAFYWAAVTQPYSTAFSVWFFGPLAATLVGSALAAYWLPTRSGEGLVAAVLVGLATSVLVVLAAFIGANPIVYQYLVPKAYALCQASGSGGGELPVVRLVPLPNNRAGNAGHRASSRIRDYDIKALIRRVSGRRAR